MFREKLPEFKFLLEEFPGWPLNEVPAIPPFMIPSHSRLNSCPSWRTPAKNLEIFIEREKPEDRATLETPRYFVVATICSTDDYMTAFAEVTRAFGIL